MAKIEDLIIKFLKKEQTAEEQIELDKWIAASEKNKQLFEQLTDQRILKKKLQTFHTFEEGKEEARKQLILFKVRRIFPIRKVAAAIIILMLSVGGYFYFNKEGLRQAQIDNVVKNDVPAPNVTKAMITLGNGQMVALDSISNGTLATQDDVKVIKNANGEIIYSGSANEVVYNTLSNPRGSKVVNLTLNDGTKVWLNAESSLKYATAFTGNERRVEITGEAYFEVTHDASKPFKVSLPTLGGAGGGEITVLGTHFNVNAFPDETTIKTTLLEGSVRVSMANPSSGSGQAQSTVLKPGQQAQLLRQESPGQTNKPAYRTGRLQIINADLERVMAWKNGLFDFETDNLADIMRQISRWYDVEVVYEGAVPVKRVTGQISKNVKVSNVLKMIELTGKVAFRIEDKKIFVKVK